MGLDHASLCNFINCCVIMCYMLCDNALQIVGYICMMGCVQKAKNSRVREHNLRGSKNK